MGGRDILAFPALAPAPAEFKLPHLSGWDLELGRVPVFDKRLGVVRYLTAFSSLWADHLGGLPAACRHVHACFGESANQVTVRDRQERDVALFAATMRAWQDLGGWPNADLYATLPFAFGLVSRAAKLDAAIAAGHPHPADPIFAAGAQHEAARAIAATVTADNMSRDAKWALFLLIGGHARRGTPPPLECLFALASALGLLDGRAHGRQGLSLAGAKPRRDIIERAAEEAMAEAGDGFEFDRTFGGDDRADEALAQHPIYALAFNDTLRRLQFFGDRSAADSSFPI